MEKYTIVSARTWKEIGRIAKLERVAIMSPNDGLQEEVL